MLLILNVPQGKLNVAPFEVLDNIAALTALMIAAVSSVMPSPFAPNHPTLAWPALRTRPNHVPFASWIAAGLALLAPAHIGIQVAR